jgi:hypothetical protein
VGSSITNNNVFGGFKFQANPIGLQYFALVGGVDHEYWPSIQAFADFRHYNIFAVNMTITEPTSGTSSAPLTETDNLAVSEQNPENFSTAKDEFQILITQTSTDIQAYFYVISSSGSILNNWNLDLSFSGVTSPPPYNHYVVSDELDGLEIDGSANLLSGTDFQIESLISPSTITDFTMHQTASYTDSSNALSVTNCGLSSFTDEEGNNSPTITYKTASTSGSGNEAYQYVEVTD